MSGYATVDDRWSTLRQTTLVLAHLDRLSNRLDRSQVNRYGALDKRGAILFGPGRPGYRAGMRLEEALAIACGGRWPDLILHGVDFKESGVPLVSGLADAQCLTALELQDSWTFPQEQAAFINAHRFDYGFLVVAHHLPLYERLCPRTRFAWTPHAIDTEIFRDYGLAKDHDVLLYGNLAPHTYPLRARLAELLARQWDLRVKIVPHPGYYPTEAERAEILQGEALAREINRSWITICTSSVYRCLMMKYYEAAACRSLIAGDMPAEGRFVFGENFLELRPEHSNWEILDRLRSALSDKERLRAKADAAHERIMRHYSTDAFAAQLFDFLAAAKKSRGAERLGTQAFVGSGHAPEPDDVFADQGATYASRG